MQIHFLYSLTFIAQPRLVLVESLEPDPLSDEVEELVEGGPALLVVVHLLLSLLAVAAVHQTDLKNREENMQNRTLVKNVL